jgi:error-prone DNA polymerase
MSYVPLWVKSNYSFLEGASHPDELVTQAAELGLPALALTDRDGVYGIVRAHVAALAQNKQTQPRATRLLYGAEVSVCAILPEGERLDPATASVAGAKPRWLRPVVYAAEPGPAAV